jgi:deoxyuridine 5'-triphosphate nucleotidohydrolase
MQDLKKELRKRIYPVNLLDGNLLSICCTQSESKDITDTFHINGMYTGNHLYVDGSNLIDLIGNVYDEKDDCVFKKFKYTKTPEAFAPSKTRSSDSGYDLTIVKLLKTVGNVYWYTTEISVQPPFGYYFDVVPRSSLSKTGYILANSVGVIDSSYTGHIIVVLIKIDNNAPDIQLPFKPVQMIPRSIEHFTPVQVETLEETDRGDGGFGSTG